jgi:hypothetical protein
MTSCGARTHDGIAADDTPGDLEFAVGCAVLSVSTPSIRVTI